MTTRLVFAFGLLAVFVLSGSACQGGAEPGGGGIGVSRQALGSSPETTNCSFASSAGRDYWFCSTERNWQTARSKCQAIGMDLATIESSAENGFVRSHVPDDSWIGANDIAVEGVWRWAQSGVQFWQGGSSGSPVGGAYTNWKSVQPNNLGNQDCAIIDDVDGKWDDKACSENREYVCEGVVDLCPNDPNKKEPGQCGCGVPDTDTDLDGTADCNDQCPNDPNKTAPGQCDCGTPDTDTDGDGVADCTDGCPNDPNKIVPGDCGCSDAPEPAGKSCNDGFCPANNQCDGAGNCGSLDQCAPGPDCTVAIYDGRAYAFCEHELTWEEARNKCRSVFGMDLVVIETQEEDAWLTDFIDEHIWIGATDAETQGDWKWVPTGQLFWTGGSGGGPVNNAYTNWEHNDPDWLAHGDCAAKDPPVGDGYWETFECDHHKAYVCEVIDLCPDDPDKIEPGQCDCGLKDTDTDFDGVADCKDVCPRDPTKTTDKGMCGCGHPETDSDNNGIPDCVDYHGTCGSPSHPAPAGTKCEDGPCPGVFECDGAGNCGNAASCSPCANASDCRVVSYHDMVLWFCSCAGTWQQADQLCRQTNSDRRLVQIDDSMENAFVAANLTTTSWIGANDLGVEGQWRWTNDLGYNGNRFWSGGAAGSAYFASYARWKPGEPGGGDPEDCAAVSAGPSDRGTWSDLSCGEQHGFVCERGRNTSKVIDGGVVEIGDIPNTNTILGIPDAGLPQDGCVPATSVFPGDNWDAEVRP